MCNELSPFTQLMLLNILSSYQVIGSSSLGVLMRNEHDRFDDHYNTDIIPQLRS